MSKKAQTSTCKYSVLRWPVLLEYAEFGIRGTLRPPKSAKEEKQIVFHFLGMGFILFSKQSEK